MNMKENDAHQPDPHSPSIMSSALSAWHLHQASKPSYKAGGGSRRRGGGEERAGSGTWRSGPVPVSPPPPENPVWIHKHQDFQGGEGNGRTGPVAGGVLGLELALLVGAALGLPAGPRLAGLDRQVPGPPLSSPIPLLLLACLLGGGCHAD